MFWETERAAKSPAATIYSPVNYPPLSWSLMSSTSVSASHPQHPSLSFIPPHLFIFPLVLTCCFERRCMIYEALFLPVTEEKERRETTSKRGRVKKEREEWREECEERAQGEGEEESVEETSITPRPLGWKWRREVGWDRNMMDLTKSRGDILQSTWVVDCYTLDTAGRLAISLTLHISLCNIFLSITHFSSALFLLFSPTAQADQITSKLLLQWGNKSTNYISAAFLLLINPFKHAGYCRYGRCKSHLSFQTCNCLLILYHIKCIIYWVIWIIEVLKGPICSLFDHVHYRYLHV